MVTTLLDLIAAVALCSGALACAVRACIPLELSLPLRLQRLERMRDEARRYEAMGVLFRLSDAALAALYIYAVVRLLS